MQEFPFRRVIVTGGAGFLGRRLVAKLRAFEGVEVFVPRKRDYDLVDDQNIIRLLEDSRPQVVIHLAAVVGGIGHNQKNPGRFLYENLMMGTQLIEQSRLHGVEKFVAIGTVCAYPKFTPTPFKEADLWNGYPEETNAPYGLAKKMMLAQLQAYRTQYGFNGIYLLPANLYGPEDSFDLETSHVIPALVRKCVTAKREGLPVIDVWGDGSPSREFLFVDDCAQGILQATTTYNGSEPVNLGTGQEIKIKDLVEMIVELTGFRGQILWQTEKPNGQPRRRLDTSRALESFGFQARTALRDGLQKTIDWYQESIDSTP